MGKAKSKGPKFAAVKKIITRKPSISRRFRRRVLQLQHSIGPPYRVIVDTNFINFSIQNKLDLEKGMMDCLYANVSI
ncbi:hypothetical protein Zm00014a_027295 [Zea mays]|uniref:rRNA-processing protein FCF1 n=1 Tax=Zea mays TaxID=4577 RepID=A0A3L6D6Q8_MAIZE|nr:hypothetical protein Zm00014a_027295 [Zea mays]PWZ04253.1 hypothetical protein Zm00014a_027295 [Zea mays]